NYRPEDLAPIKYYAEDRTPGARFMRQEAAEHFHGMVEAAEKNGISVVMTTAYRDYDFQKTLYDNYVSNEGQAEADKFSAKPGQSEHQTGLAVDVTSASVGYALTYEFGQSQEGKWLAEHAHEFGFILRFPEDKREITGYNYEPWHFRYVGQDIAREIYKEKITLEEFIDRMED
ncbi:MAG: M15 family metallopeptidase, partial [Anaerovorax sp.]